MAKNYWVITRPKRKLILIPDLLKIFSTVVEGQKWEGNRSLQFQFEESLKNYEWKAQHTSKEASGARTYAAMLYMLGLWFEDASGVQITNAGKELVADKPPVPILTKQLLDFQYPSPYSIKSQVGVSRDFHIQPHRFILRLMIEKNIEEITQDEIAFCLVPYAKTNGDLSKCAEIIKQFRIHTKEMIKSAVLDSGTSEDNLRNIGNTVVNQLEYTGYFEERTEIKSLRIKQGMLNKVSKVLEQQRDSLIQNPDDAPTFQMRYGSGLETAKDYRYSAPIPPKLNPNDRAIMVTYLEIALNEPIESISEGLIERIAQLRGVSKEQTRKVLSTFAQKPQFDRFEEKYLQLSVGGTATADDFEVKTTGIFSKDGFGFAALWVGSKPRYPDLFVFFDKNNKQHGLIDTKAYKEYTLPLDHKNIMAHTYIPSFKKIEFDGTSYNLKFYCYVSGGFGSGMRKSFNELSQMTSIRGSYITAANLLQLLRIHRTSPISAEKFGEIFSSNQEVLYDKI
jgi:hypothetical protein